MAMRRRSQRPRPAFTLVEMLVAMALILFIMVILSQAFVSGLESFRQLKAIGDLEERMRTAAIGLRRDLNADHFEGRRRLSDPNFWYQPVREGFFRIYQGGPSIPEGTDDVGNPSFRAVTHRLHFSVKLRGNQLDKFFSANLVPANPTPEALALIAGGTTFFDQPADGRFQDTGPGAYVYSSPWAEIAYFLVPDPVATAGKQQLYSLYRTQLLVVPDNRKLNWPTTIFPGGQPIANNNAAAVNAFKPMSCQTENLLNPKIRHLYFNNPSDLAHPFADMQNPPPQRRQPRRGVYDLLNPDISRSTLLLADVISFQVQVFKSGAPDFSDIILAANSSGSFDTGEPTTEHLNISAIQVVIRVWDSKTNQARQITIIQDM